MRTINVYKKISKKNKKFTPNIQILTKFGVNFIFYIVILSRIFLK